MEVEVQRAIDLTKKEALENLDFERKKRDPMTILNTLQSATKARVGTIAEIQLEGMALVMDIEASRDKEQMPPPASRVHEAEMAVLEAKMSLMEISLSDTDMKRDAQINALKDEMIHKEEDARRKLDVTKAALCKWTERAARAELELGKLRARVGSSDDSKYAESDATKTLTNDPKQFANSMGLLTLKRQITDAESKHAREVAAMQTKHNDNIRSVETKWAHKLHQAELRHAGQVHILDMARRKL